MESQSKMGINKVTGIGIGVREVRTDINRNRVGTNGAISNFRIPPDDRVSDRVAVTLDFGIVSNQFL